MFQSSSSFFSAKRYILFSFVAAFSLFAVIPVTCLWVDGAIAVERQGVPTRREGGGSR